MLEEKQQRKETVCLNLKKKIMIIIHNFKVRFNYFENKISLKFENFCPVELDHSMKIIYSEHVKCHRRHCLNDSLRTKKFSYLVL